MMNDSTYDFTKDTLPTLGQGGNIPLMSEKNDKVNPCLVCLDKFSLIDNDLLEGIQAVSNKIPLDVFCCSINFSISAKQNVTFHLTDTPLCSQCTEKVCEIIDLQEKIKELEKSVSILQTSLKDNVLSSTVDISRFRFDTGGENTICGFIQQLHKLYGNGTAPSAHRRKSKKKCNEKPIEIMTTRSANIKSLMGQSESGSSAGIQSETLHGEAFKKTIRVKVEEPFPLDLDDYILDESIVDESRAQIEKGSIKPEMQKTKFIIIKNESGAPLTEENEHEKLERKKVKLKKLQCKLCSSAFAEQKNLNRHMIKVHEETGEFSCKCCNKKFTKMNDLINHKKSEHRNKFHKLNDEGKKTFECEFCGIVFKNHCDILIHRRRHTGERPFQCETCYQNFISKSQYQFHVEVEHPQVPPLKCTFCPRSFFKHHRLRDHTRTHTGEKCYLCEVCSMAFSQTTHLKFHQTKHKELNLEEFKCNDCGKKFASPSNLQNHRETQHMKKYRYHCNICGHGTVHKSHLNFHMRSHTGERPFACSHCDKTFTRASLLKIHIRTHTNERPYVCNICTKGFISNSRLKRHENVHDNDTKRPKKPKRTQKKPATMTTDNESSSVEIISDTPVTATAELGSSLVPLPQQQLLNLPVAPQSSTINNDQQIFKLEEFYPAEVIAGEQQLITFLPADTDGMYEIIASTNESVNIAPAETFTEYIILNCEIPSDINEI